MKIGERFEQLEAIMSRLRAEDGCPWDREQTLDSLRSYLVEECYEVLDALEANDSDAHREELGDLLFQIVFQSQIRKEEGAFDLGDVALAISDKLLRRHPHVFGDQQALTRAEIRTNWAAEKRRERLQKGGDMSALAGIPKAMPALLRALRLGEKASIEGFDWPTAAGVRHKLTEEIAELDQALESGHGIENELGDILLTVVNLCRHLDVSPDNALARANARFEARFRWVESELLKSNHVVGETESSELERLWGLAKKALAEE
ncbi:MAG: nucleoside triphosphate pyrophosphohydrolase [Myxococcota bacterium]|nr:nucleoside triphosphate pyrophosphohydrolase [Myxococcota bacterium]